MSNKTIPTDFTGLIYAPSLEVELYMLTAFLLPYLPFPLVFEEFELDPRRKGYKHSKYLDAKGRKLVDHKWKEVTIEFKLYSSGFLVDVKRHPTLKNEKVNLIICWVHDAPEVERYADEVISLQDILLSLTDEKRKRIILFPDKKSKLTSDTYSMEDLLSYFKSNRLRMERLLNLWVQHAPNSIEPGTSEMKFKRGNRVMFRACSYSSGEKEHLLVTPDVGLERRQTILARFHGKLLPKTNQINVPLANIQDNDLSDFISTILGK